MADKLINTNVVLSLIDEEIAEHYSYYSDQTLKRIREAIEKLPGVDVVPVMRCKDCERWHRSSDGNWYCINFSCLVGDEDGNAFCSEWERRNDE